MTVDTAKFARWGSFITSLPKSFRAHYERQAAIASAENQLMALLPVDKWDKTLEEVQNFADMLCEGDRLPALQVFIDLAALGDLP